jgi:hypothetical protein
MRHPDLISRLFAVSALVALLSCGGDSGGTTDPSDNPVPALNALSRDTATGGIPQFAITLRGTGFMAGAVGTVDGNARTTDVTNDSTAWVTILPQDLANAGAHLVRIKNPDPTDGPSAPLTFTVLAAPVPTIDSLSPDTLPSGAPGFTLHVYGTGFLPQSVIKWGATSLTTTRADATHLFAAVTAPFVATPGSTAVTIFTPTPGGGTSGAKPFVVRPPPAISRIAPDTMRTGGAPQTLHIYGQGFTAATTVSLNTVNEPSAPSVTFVADTEITIQVPLGQLTTKKLATICLAGCPTYKVLHLLPPLLVVNSISPDSAALGDSIVFTARGSGFVPPGGDYSNTLVRWRGEIWGPPFLTDTTLQVVIPYDKGLAGGVVSVAFVNQGTTDTVHADFTITRPVPVITELTPAHDTTGAEAMTIFGRAMGIDSTVQVYVNGVLHPSAGLAPYPWDTSGYFSAQLSAGEAATPGPREIKLVNLGPGGGTSTPDTLWLSEPNPVPVLDSVTPYPVAIGSTGTTVTVHGRKLLPGAVAYVAQKDLEYNYSQQFPTTWIDSGTVQFTLPDTLAADAFTLSVRLLNPSPTADISARVMLYVRSAEITRISHLDLSVSRLIGDTVHQRMYATVPGYVSGTPRLVVIDPLTPAVSQDLPVPGEVGALVISDDHHWLVAAFPEQKLLRRYDLTTLTVDRTWNGPRNDYDSILAPISIGLLHGSGHTLAVLSAADFSVDGLNELVIFDDTLQRPRALHVLNWEGADLEFPSDSMLVDVQAYATGWRIYPVDGLGPDTLNARQVGSSQPVNIWIRGDTVITANGLVADLRTGSTFGQLPGGSMVFGGAGLVFTKGMHGYNNPVYELRATDLATFAPSGSPISTTGLQVTPEGPFVRWKSGGFAWAGAAGIDFIEVSRPGW